MAELLLGNLDDDVTDDEIKALLIKYGFPSYDAIQHVPGTGSHPAVLVSFGDTAPEILQMLQPRIQHIFWRNRTLNAIVVKQREG
jgi:hypothetical protein